MLLFNRIFSVFGAFKEDFRVFWGKQPGGVFKVFYFPDIRVVFIYRLSQFFYEIKVKPLAYFFTNLNDFFHGVWIGPRVVSGKGLSLGHPRGIVINPSSKIGNYVTMINQVTLGGPNVVIEDFVEIGAGAKIISTKDRVVVIGRHSIIGAGSVVTKSIPPYSIVVGVPGRAIKKKILDEWIVDHPYYLNVVN